MKRTYISPVVYMVTIQPQRMLALSTIDVSSSNYEEGTMTDLVKSDNNYSVWDDDWSE